MSLRTDIFKNKREINAHTKRVNKILTNAPELRSKFNSIMSKKSRKKTRTLGNYDSMVSRDFIAEEEAAAEPSWYESDFMSKLIDFGATVGASKLVNQDQKDNLKLELQQINAKNDSLDRQMALQMRLEASRKSNYGASYLNTLLDNPMAIAGVLGLAGLFIYGRMKAKRR